MQYIALDAHKKYTFASVETEQGKILLEGRVDHRPGALATFLAPLDKQSPVALESVGNWYWMMDEIQEAGMNGRLVHPRKAKLMMGMINKTDKLDARGMNRLQRNGTLPIVWIPPADLRDKRDLPRTRMVLSKQKTQLKNRIHSTLDKYMLTMDEVTDIFGATGRDLLDERVKQLPENTRYATEQLLEELDQVQTKIQLFDKKIREVFQETEEVKYLKTIPGIGPVLSIVIHLEVGNIDRFASADRLESYAGTTPRVHASGGKTRIGSLRSDVNHYLKWAFAEAANQICLHRGKHPSSVLSRLYEKVKQKKGHAVAIGAVARHLAKATYWVLKKKENYKEPYQDPKRGVSSTGR